MKSLYSKIRKRYSLSSMKYILPIVLGIIFFLLLGTTFILKLPIDSDSPVAEAISQTSPSFPFGLSLLAHPEDLPQLRPQVFAQKVSSHDKTGGNSDFGGQWDCDNGGANPWPEGLESYHYMEDGKYVIFDEKGPGAVTRMRFREYGSDRLRFYFDGESTPRLDLTISEMFDGAHPPFLKPLVGGPNDNSGGYISFVPLPFAQSLKIIRDREVDVGTYQITFQKLDPSIQISSFTGNEDVSDIATKWQNLGTDPKPTTGNISETGTIPIAQGNTATLFQRNSAGTISAVKINIPQIVPASLSASDISDPQQVASRELLSRVKIKAYWDGEATPSVNAPLGGFFGSTFGEVESKSLFFGTTTQEGGFYYNYFPMPFNTNAKVEIVNESNVDISSLSYEIIYNPASYPDLGDSAGYFRANFRQEVPTTTGDDFKMAQISGQGQVVGVVMFAHGRRLTPPPLPPGLTNYMEGDDRVYFDGSQHPAIYGTGTEEYFGGANHFEKGMFSSPLHGFNFHITDGETFDERSMYRINLAGALPFRSGIDFGIEHGDAAIFCDLRSSHPSDYYATVFWYGLDDPVMSPTDEINVGDQVSGAEHGYGAEGALPSGQVTYQYEGDNDEVDVTDTIQAASGPVTFTVDIAPGKAVILRRRFDNNFANQKAVVYVDNNQTGTWYTPGRNSAKRWKDSEFVIPASETQGKTSIDIELIPTTPWTAARYWAFSMDPGAAEAPADTDDDGFSDEIELAIGTDPNSACSTTSGTDAWPPDVDKNGVVNISDIFLVAGSFGHNSQDADWDLYKRYDLDTNGAVSMSDIFIVAGFFGQSFC